MLAGELALTTAAVFTGAAFYVNFAEQPARLTLPSGPLLAEFKPSYERGKTMQASLAIIGALFGAWAFYGNGDWLWLAGAILLIANWPYTLLVIMPTNTHLIATDPAKADEATRDTIRRWGVLHAARTALGAAATIAFLFAAK
jgi:hypothetical protein